jgi:hypothetical protein
MPRLHKRHQIHRHRIAVILRQRQRQ